MGDSTSTDTMFNWLEGHERDQADALAVVCSENTMTFAELAESSRRLAAGLADIDVGPGDVVAVQLPNCPEFLTLLLACVARGATIQTMHMPYRHAELSSLLDHGQAKVVVGLGSAGDRSRVAEMVALAGDLPHLRTVVSLGESTDGAVDFAELAAASPTDATVVEPDADAPYVLLYTSGTTAGPKGVLHPAKRFLPNAALASTELELSPKDRVMSLAPFSHLYGLFTLQIAMAAGSCVTMVPVFNPQTILDDLVELAPSAVFAAPAHFAPFVANDQLQPEHLESIRILCMSGSAVPPPLATAVDALLGDGSVIGLWGMTELQVGSFGRPDDPFESRTSTTGRAATGMELRVVDADGHPVAAGSEGELHARGSATFDGYLRNPEATAEAFSDDGWFKTGDLAEIDADGFLRITGRTTEIINRGGIKYNPAEVEAIVLDQFAVSACAVVPFADDVLGERGCLCAQVAPDAAITLDEVCTRLEHHGLAKYKWPERLELFDELPMTPTRKVQRAKLAELLAERSS